MTTDARIGSELAGYRIETAIGRGGMGVVYRAEQLRLGRKVALKLLAPELAENAGFRARFEHESRLAAALDHPNIVPLYEAGEADGLLFISMRYVEGTDLRAVLTRHGRLETDRALRIAAQVAAALDAAHARGLVHRDVKPGNILVAPGPSDGAHEHCYLTDFGLTKDTSSSVELTATGTFVGTIDYIAPEQIEGSTPDGRGDQYALACVLSECLTGHPPFVRDEEIGVMWAHLQDEPPSITSERPDLPSAIDAVIARAMAKDPAQRFPTCSAMVTAARSALMPSAPIAPAQVTRAHAKPAAVTRVGGAAAAPPLAAAAAAPPLAAAAAPPLAPPPGAPPAPPTVAPARAPEPEPAPAARRRRGPLLAIAAGVAILVAAVAGVLVGNSGSDEATAAGTTASSADVELRYDAPWKPGGDAAVIPGLTLAQPVALTSGGASVVAGRIANPGPGLLPAGVKAKATDAVKLGPTAALRHSGVPAKGGVPSTVYVVPTDHGAAAVACVGATASSCEAIAATLRLRTANALGVKPDAAYAKDLSALLAAQSRRESADRAALGRAGNSRAQGPVAADAYRAQAKLAARVRALRPETAREANEHVAAAIGAIARGYRGLAKAARAHDPAAYAAAGRVLRGAHGDLADAVAVLGLLGYDVKGGS